VNTSGKIETVVVSARIPKALHERFVEKMKKNGFLNVSDFLRYIIRYYVEYGVPLVVTSGVKCE